MIYRRYEPYGWACVAGHTEAESFEDSMIREYSEEAGLKVVGLQLLMKEYVPWNFCRKSRGMGHEWQVYKVFCLGEIKISEEETQVDPKTGRRWGWFSREEIAELDLEPVWRRWFEKLGYIVSRPLPIPEGMTKEQIDSLPVSEGEWREHPHYGCHRCGKPAFLHPYTNSIWGCKEEGFTTYSVSIYFKKR